MGIRAGYNLSDGVMDVGGCHLEESLILEEGTRPHADPSKKDHFSGTFRPKNP